MRGVKAAKRFDQILEGLNIDELKILVSEAQAAIKKQEVKKSKMYRSEVALKIRDALRIGSVAYFVFEGKPVAAPVCSIAAEKIQVELDNGKRKVKSIGILKLLTAAEYHSAVMKYEQENGPEENNTDNEKEEEKSEDTEETEETGDIALASDL